MNKEVEITGRIPDLEAIGTGLAFGLAGAISLVAGITTFKPEYDKILDATSCSGDCTFTKAMLAVLMLASMLGGAICSSYGVYLVGKAIFGINTIRAKIRGV